MLVLLLLASSTSRCKILLCFSSSSLCYEQSILYPSTIYREKHFFLNKVFTKQKKLLLCICTFFVSHYRLLGSFKHIRPIYDMFNLTPIKSFQNKNTSTMCARISIVDSWHSLALLVLLSPLCHSVVLFAILFVKVLTTSLQISVTFGSLA